MRVCTNAQMRELDSLTINKYGIAGEQLMERAGLWVALIADKYLETYKKKVIIFCGGGNNGGDGFVAARYLTKMGFDTEVILVANPDSLKGDALLNFKRMNEAKISWRTFEPKNFNSADLLIDALLGTGISGAPKGDIAAAVKSMNDSKIPILAVDIPSGVNGDNGAVGGIAICAEMTVTFGFPKIGHFIHPGRARTGGLFIGDIGLHKQAIDETPVSIEVATIQETANLLPCRPPDGHKGTFGKGLIIAGSQGMTGAAVLAGISFLRSGAGLCYVAVPRSLVDVVDANAIEVVVLPMPEVRKKRCHSLRALGELHKIAKDVDAIAIGPGIGRNEETAEMVRRFVSRISKPIVIDADGLNALAGHANDVVPQITAPAIMTPHVGELARLLDLPMEQIEDFRLEKANEWAKYLYTTLVIKGNPTIIAQSDGALWLNPTGNNGMATAGSGDVLTGLVCGFLAQGLSTLDSAKMGAYVHGLAGDISADLFTQRAMLAGDIAECISGAFTAIENSQHKVDMRNEFLDVSYTQTSLGAGMTLLE